MNPLAPPLGVAAFLAFLALLVLLAQPGRWLNRIFAALLLVRAASTATYGLMRGASDAEDAFMLARVTVWYTLATPVLLVALMGVLFLRRSPRLRFGLLAAAALGAGALALVHVAAPNGLVGATGAGARGTYGFDSTPLFDAFRATVTLLEVGLVLLAARACRSPHESALSRRQSALLGLAFAFVPLHGGAFFAVFLGLMGPGVLVARTLQLATALVALAAIAAAAPTLLRGVEGGSRRLAFTTLGFATVVGVLDALAVTPAYSAFLLPGYDTGVVLTRAAFAGTAALALLRYGLAGAQPETVRRFEALARAGLVLSAAVLAAGLVLAFMGLTTAGLVAAPLLGLGVLLLSPAPLAPTADRLVRRILLKPQDPVEEAARLERERPLDPDGTRPLLGRYRLLRELGRGATSTVHLAEDLLKGERVVVKRLHGGSSRAALAEARALGSVRHPRVVPLHDVEQVGGETFLVLGHVPGGTARERLDREGPLHPAEACRLALDVLEGLEALHAQGVAHGDVKPENVLLDADGRGVLGDLGSARFFTVDVTTTGSAGGASLSTVAPEALRGEKAGASADLYAAAATLHRLLTGRHYVALEDADAFQARERILLDAPRLPDPRVPPPVEKVLRRALSKRPAERPPGAADMAEDLRVAMAVSGILVHEERAAHAHDVARP